MSNAAPDRALRKDAAENRERILAAASDLFAKHGLHVTLNDIARHAGVGVGTAYRRFANKEEVIDALFEERMQAVVDAAQAALANPDAWDGLLTFLEQDLQMRHGDQGLNEIMNNSLLGDARVSDVRDQIAPLITQLVEKGKSQGVLRQDLDQTDVIFLQLALSAIVESTRDIAPELYRRYLTILLDGIRAHDRGFSPLPVAPLTAHQTHQIMTRRRRAPA
jgi:AcrR family transcriptional regulator